MSMPAISLHQPWASLCVTRQPCWLCDKGLTHVESNHREPMVKRFETRSWPCPPNLIGQRIALHATKRKPPTIPGENALAVGDYRCWSISQRQPDHPHGAHPGASYIGHADPRLLMMNPLPLGAIIGSVVVEACYPIDDFDAGHDPAWPHICLDERPDSSARLYPGSIEGDYGDNISDQIPYGDWTPGRFAWLLADAKPVPEPIPCPGHQRIWYLPDDIAALVEASL